MEPALKYNQESHKAQEILLKELNINLSDLDFQIALAASLGYDREKSTMVVSHALSAEEMVERLKNFDFKIPQKIGEVKFKKTILPNHLPKRIDEQTIKDSGEIWVIHKNDADPRPSNPHAHNVETGYKLHLGNGDLYSPKNTFLGKHIHKKNLMVIRRKVKNHALPELTV